MLIRRLLTGLFAAIPFSTADTGARVGCGHILLEGVPGVAKTLTVTTLARAIAAKFQRLQLTPDMMPADILGTRIYEAKTATFRIERGPVFTNILLADEINRARPKTQSALLEAMQERQVTLAENTFPLHDPFWVLATQNPVEQEGVYALPEAQLDRFSMMLRVDYPAARARARDAPVARDGPDRPAAYRAGRRDAAPHVHPRTRCSWTTTSSTTSSASDAPHDIPRRWAGRPSRSCSWPGSRRARTSTSWRWRG